VYKEIYTPLRCRHSVTFILKFLRFGPCLVDGGGIAAKLKEVKYTHDQNNRTSQILALHGLYPAAFATQS
jgi:hypothetical protein